MIKQEAEKKQYIHFNASVKEEENEGEKEFSFPFKLAQVNSYYTLQIRECCCNESIKRIDLEKNLFIYQHIKIITKCSNGCTKWYYRVNIVRIIEGTKQFPANQEMKK